MDNEVYEKTDEVAEVVLDLYMEAFNLFSCYERLMAYSKSDNNEAAIDSIDTIYDDLDNMDRYKVELKEELVKLKKLLED